MKTVSILKKGVKLISGLTTYRLSLEVTSTQDITKNIFVKQRQKFPNNTFKDVFVAVASPAQLVDLDENSPAEGDSYFRSNSIELDSSNPDFLNDVFTTILAEVQLLVDQAEILDEISVDGVYTITSTSVTIDMDKQHTHYRIPLTAQPCGINEVYVDYEDGEIDKHRVTDQDADLPGWLNTTGADPSATFFKYNIAQDSAVSAIWPPADDKLAYAHIEVNGVVNKNFTATAAGLFWKTNEYGQVPWPKTYVNSGDLGDPADSMTLVLSCIV